MWLRRLLPRECCGDETSDKDGQRQHPLCPVFNENESAGNCVRQTRLGLLFPSLQRRGRQRWLEPGVCAVCWPVEPLPVRRILGSKQPIMPQALRLLGPGLGLPKPGPHSAPVLLESRLLVPMLALG